MNLDFRSGRWFLLLLCALPLTLAAAKDRATPAFGPDYGSALAAADHFLQAWQSGDAENGMALLSSHVKERTTTEALDQFFGADALPNKRAYEIGRGKMLKRGHYEFPVVLMSRASQEGHARRRFSSIILVNTGHNDWAVDRLP